MNPSGLVHNVVATGVIEAGLLVWLLIVVAYFGDSLVRRLVPRDTFALERLVFSCGLGLGALGLLTLLLGSLGLFHGWLFKSLFGILSIPVVYRLLELRRQAIGRWPDWGSGSPGRLPRAVSWVAAALVIFTLGVGLIAALGPETEFDALNHHLGTVRLYLVSHAVVKTPSMAWAAHPLLVEMLYAFAWLAGDQLLAKLVHFGLGLLTALACYLFCRRHFSSAAGWLSAAVLLCSPIVLYLLQSAYIDLGLALFGFLSVWAFHNWMQTRHTGWIVLAGLLCGFCLGTKYFGAVVPISLIGYSLPVWFRSRRAGDSPVVPARLIAFLAIALVVFVPWLLKNLVLFGNPVAPFLADRIPANFLAVEDYRQLSALTSTWGGLDGGLADYLRSPWLLTFKPEIFVGSIGPVFLLFLPLALLLGFRNRTLCYVGVCALVQYALIVAATRNVRYFVVVLPLLSILIAGGLFPSRRASRPRGILAVLLLIVCLLQMPWFVRLWEDHPSLVVSPAKIRLFTTDEARRQQLDLWLGPGGARMHEFLDRTLPEGGRVLALTPVYQALTDRTVFMTPNSALSSRLSLQALDTARLAAQMKVVQIDVANLRGARGRVWRIRVPSSGDSGLEPVVRFFYREAVPLEISVFDRLVRTSSGELQLLVALGTERRVDYLQVWLPEHLAAKRIILESSGAPGPLRHPREWTPVPVQQKILPEQALSRYNLIQNMKSSAVLYVVVQDVPVLHFLPSFFEQGGEAGGFRRLASVGNYRIYQLVIR